MRNRSVAFVVLSFVLLVGGCREPSDPGSDGGVSPLSPAVPSPSAPAPTSATPNWKATAVVVSVTRGTEPPCGWGTSPGETRSDVGWRIVVTADTISLDEDMKNWPTDDLPYSGNLSGAGFIASYASPSNYADYVCQFREAAITGSFTSDSTFEAVETLVWGRPGSETTVQRHWNGSRL